MKRLRQKDDTISMAPNEDPDFQPRQQSATQRIFLGMYCGNQADSLTIQFYLVGIGT